jgi:hypothetical protein
MDYKEAYNTIKNRFADTNYLVMVFYLVKGEYKPIIKNDLIIKISGHFHFNEYENILKEMKSIEESPDFICWCVDDQKFSRFNANPPKGNLEIKN